jgi:hypothetical protein
VKQRLRIKNEEDDRLIPLVSAYVFLQERNPRKLVRRSDAERYAFVIENLPQMRCTGKQLYEALQKLNPKPSPATICRWGQEIGCPVYKRKYKNKVYTERQVQLWVEKIISQTHFRFADHGKIDETPFG